MRKPFSFIYTIHFVYQANKFYAFVTDFYRYCDNYSYVPSKSNAVILILSYSSHGICRKGIHKMGLHDILVDLSETVIFAKDCEEKYDDVPNIRILKTPNKGNKNKKKKINWIIAIDDDNNNNNDGNYAREITSNKNSIAFRIWQRLLDSFDTVFCWIEWCVLFQFSP